MLHTASLRELVTVQRVKASPTVDGLGHVNLSDASNWETYCTAYCEISEVGSNMARRVGVTRETTSHVVRLRYCAGHAAITGAMRVRRRDGSLLAIVATPRDPDQRRQELVLEAVTGVL